MKKVLFYFAATTILLFNSTAKAQDVYGTYFLPGYGYYRFENRAMQGNLYNYSRSPLGQYDRRSNPYGGQLHNNIFQPAPYLAVPRYQSPGYNGGRFNNYNDRYGKPIKR